MISPKLHPDSVGTMYTTPSCPAARIHAASPSGCPILHMATAERKRGSAQGAPSRRVLMSMFLTLTMTRGRSHRRWKALWFSRSVISSSPPEE